MLRDDGPLDQEHGKIRGADEAGIHPATMPCYRSAIALCVVEIVGEIFSCRRHGATGGLKDGWRWGNVLGKQKENRWWRREFVVQIDRDTWSKICFQLFCHGKSKRPWSNFFPWPIEEASQSLYVIVDF